MSLQDIIRSVDSRISSETERRYTLKDLDLIVLDNSIRESTVGQHRGHTLENKWKIFKEVKKCGFEFIVVAAFSHMTAVDDKFIREIVAKEEDVSNLFAFTELIESVGKDGIPCFPVGLRKMMTLGLVNPIIEIDLATDSINWDVFTIKEMCQLLLERMEWSRRMLSPGAKIMVNLRDFPTAMVNQMERVFTVVDYLASLSDAKRPFGIMFEEPTGNFLPTEVGAWTAGVRRIMESRGWSGHLLAHVHEKWALAEMTQLECLVNGANGIWASVCEEGAALGHACSTVTLMNLVRMGNTKVKGRYNCTYLRNAASNVTEITTGSPPHPKQVIYGERALDWVFDVKNIAGGTVEITELNLAKFFGEEAPVRISTLSSDRMVQERLIELFGEDPQFTMEIAQTMKRTMHADLTHNRKEDYMSAAGIALLFKRSGGNPTAKMVDVIGKTEDKSELAKHLIGEVRKIWDKWDIEENKTIEDRLLFRSFYNGFMAPYFSSFTCSNTQKVLKEIDMQKDGYIDWNEFLVYLKWAMNDNPDIVDVHQLLSFVFCKGIIPAMQTRLVRKRPGNIKINDNDTCKQLRNAASYVPQITSGSPPYPKQVIYGERATDRASDFKIKAGGTKEAPVRINTMSSDRMIPHGYTVEKTELDLARFFGEEAPVRISTLSSDRMKPHSDTVEKTELDLARFFGEEAPVRISTLSSDRMKPHSDTVEKTEHDLARFFGEEAPVRISTLSSDRMIHERLVHLFGQDPQFTMKIAKTMKKTMFADLTENRTEEYMSAAGIALLFKRSGGNPTAKMVDVIEKTEVKSELAKHLIGEVRKIWDKWDIEENKAIEGRPFYSFYNAFMAPYVSSFTRNDPQKVLKEIDMHKDGYINWNEFLVYLKWAMNDNPSIADVDQLLSFVFRKGIIPAMYTTFVREQTNFKVKQRRTKRK